MQNLSSPRNDSWLTWFLRGVLLLGMLILVGRLAELQVIKGEYYKELAEDNRIRRIPIAAPRGKILARGGEVLVGNKEVEKKVFFDDSEGLVKTTDLEGAKEEEIITEWERDYKLGAALAHVTGYVGEVNEEELGKVNPSCADKGPRSPGSFVGRGGLEEEYQCLLSGIPGEELVEVDTSGRKIRTLGRKNPVPGKELKTNIDYHLQKKVAEIMENGTEEVPNPRGSVVITDTNGEVLALYSSPSFDPNLFVSGQDSERLNRVLKDSSLPMFDRGTSGAYPPGSVFKPVVALSALEEDAIEKDFTYEDTGEVTVNGFSYTNWYYTQYGGVEGEIDVVEALARSTDTFFYKVGEHLGINNLAARAKEFGFGEATGIDLPGETEGLFPTPKWKESIKGEKWYLGNTYHVSIGQGDLSASPMQVNQSISAIASGGFLCTPSIAKSDIAGEELLLKDRCRSLKLSKENIEVVKKGMVQVCKPGGTGFTFFDFKRDVACKTGTAETFQNGKTHAWFTAFAPVNNPEIVVTVLVEEGGEGSRNAGPIARKIFNYWFGELDVVEQKLPNTDG